MPIDPRHQSTNQLINQSTNQPINPSITTLSVFAFEAVSIDRSYARIILSPLCFLLIAPFSLFTRQTKTTKQKKRKKPKQKTGMDFFFSFSSTIHFNLTSRPTEIRTIPHTTPALTATRSLLLLLFRLLLKNWAHARTTFSFIPATTLLSSPKFALLRRNLKPCMFSLRGDTNFARSHEIRCRLNLYARRSTNSDVD